MDFHRYIIGSLSVIDDIKTVYPELEKIEPGLSELVKKDFEKEMNVFVDFFMTTLPKEFADLKKLIKDCQVLISKRAREKKNEEKAESYRVELSKLSKPCEHSILYVSDHWKDWIGVLLGNLKKNFSFSYRLSFEERRKSKIDFYHPLGHINDGDWVDIHLKKFSFHVLSELTSTVEQFQTVLEHMRQLEPENMNLRLNLSRNQVAMFCRTAATDVLNISLQ